MKLVRSNSNIELNKKNSNGQNLDDQDVIQDQVVQKQPQSLLQPISQFYQKNKKTSNSLMAFSILVLFSVGYTFISKDFNAPVKNVQQYYFQVYCPINGMTQRKNYQKYIKSMNLSKDQAEELKGLQSFIESDSEQSIDKYIVWIQARYPPNINNTTEDKENYTQLYYCGYVRNWNDSDCSNPQPICSSPGPLFYVQKDNPIDVAWVYNIDVQMAKELKIVGQFNSFPNCYFGRYDSNKCPIRAKKSQKVSWFSCTYEDPTNISPQDTTEKIDTKITDLPIGTHIHGLQVRPTFDGNPLSSMNMNERVGVGYQSMTNANYYKLFNHYVPTKIVLSPGQQKYIKINRYDNTQPPGNLWYHDHAMHATYTNVALGLAGGYIIYDKEVDNKLPTKENEIIIIIAGGYQTNISKINQSQAHMKQNPLGSTFNSSIITPVFFRNQTYRFRILNGEFDAIFTNLKFVAGCRVTPQGYDLNNCKYTLNLSVIGADSTLFDKPVGPITSFTLASSERIQFLLVINGGGTNNLDANISQILLVSDSDRKVQVYIRRKFKLQKNYKVNTMDPAIPPNIGGVAFYNLSRIPSIPCNSSFFSKKETTSQCIAARRMRPLFRDSNFSFFINGHYHFSESGASQNPMIGTTEDWYFINTMTGNAPIHHPMHIHLISFQVLQRGSLKIAAQFTQKQQLYSCTHYQLDYYKRANYPFRNPSNITENCYEIRIQILINKKATAKLFNQVFRENSEDDSQTHLYGLDIEQLSTNVDAYKGLNCPTSSKYKYVCEDNLQVPEWYKHWKEVVTIYSGEYIRIRIRWASTDYDESKSSYPYFKVPEDQLIEFPGYVYHCHFLQHQDNELMRPIMMQPSPFFPSQIQNQDMRKCMTGKPQGWEERAKCINNITKCK